MGPQSPPHSGTDGRSVRVVMELDRDEEGHIAGWIERTDGEEHFNFVGTLELLALIVDRFAPDSAGGPPL